MLINCTNKGELKVTVKPIYRSRICVYQSQKFRGWNQMYKYGRRCIVGVVYRTTDYLVQGSRVLIKSSPRTDKNWETRRYYS